jgi:uncharacterized lipoprotein YajG
MKPYKIIGAMKSFFALMLIPAIVVLSGCATGKNALALDPVGPSPNQPAADNATNGTLVVYSAYEVNADFNARDPQSPGVFRLQNFHH